MLRNYRLLAIAGAGLIVAFGWAGGSDEDVPLVERFALAALFVTFVAGTHASSWIRARATPLFLVLVYVVALWSIRNVAQSGTRPGET